MATNTSGGSTSSFYNTPQATDDCYTRAEDGTYYFDVMADDLGGNAKVLWSIDDTNLDGTAGVANSGDGTLDLTIRDLANVANYSDKGARIWVTADGKVGYDASIFNYLGANESACDKFTYAIRLSNGTLSWATVTVTITGSEDGPTINSAASGFDVAGGVTEKAEPNEGGTLSDSGLITFNDADLTDIHSATVLATVKDGSGNAIATPLGSLILGTVDQAGDKVTWSYSVADGALDYLPAGQTLTQVYTVRVSDNHGGWVDQQVTITLTGTNDAAVIGTPTVADVTEDTNVTAGNLTATGAISITDTDTGEGHFSTTVTGAAGNLGTLTLAADGTYSYSVANSATQSLAGSDANGGTSTHVDTFTVTAADGTTKQVSFTIHGQNDAPDIRLVATGTPDTASVTLTETNAGLSASGTLTVTDPDLSDTISTTVSSVSVSGNAGSLSNAQLLAMLGAAPASGLAANSADTHNLTWNFNSGSEAFNYLATNETLTLTYTLTSADGHGGTDTQLVTVLINGTNDAGTDLVFTYTAQPGNSLPNGAFGQITAIDPDGGAAPSTFSITNLSATVLTTGAVASGFAGDITISSTGVVSASNLDDDRVYEVAIQVTQGTSTFSETFSVITGTNASDTVNGVPANGDDVIFAQGQGDFIFAGSGNDTVFGQAAADFIHGGSGTDTLFGGAGNDTFYFEDALINSNVDTLKDLDAGGNGSGANDKINLDDAVFTGLAPGALVNGTSFVSNAGGSASGTQAQVIFNSTTGDLYYDDDGTGAHAAVLFAHIDLSGFSGTLDGSDFLIF